MAPNRAHPVAHDRVFAATSVRMTPSPSASVSRRVWSGGVTAQHRTVRDSSYGARGPCCPVHCLSRLAAGSARCRQSHRPELARRWPPWTATGPSVVVGDRAGNVWAFHLSNGSTTPGWPAHTGVPVDSTPVGAGPTAQAPTTSIVDAGNASQPTVGRLLRLRPTTGAQIWHVRRHRTSTARTACRPLRRSAVLNGVSDRRGAVTGPERVRASNAAERGHAAGLAVLHG